MKVLQVNCVYKKGSTGKITYDLHRGLKNAGIESVVCYGRGELVNEPGVYKTCPEWYSKLNNAWSRVTGIMYGGCFFSTNRLISVIKKEQPDIVHLQCINGYFVNIYRLVNWLKKNHQKTVLTLHAEFMFTGGCGYSIDCNQWRTRTGCGYSNHCPRWRSETKSLLFDGTHRMWEKLLKAFRDFDKQMIVVSVSPWLTDRARHSTILANMRHDVVLNGLDTSVFKSYDSTEMRGRLRVQGRKVVFHATPFFTNEPGNNKGGYYICELARRMPEICVFVAGSYKEGISVPDNVHLLGRINDQVTLAKYYSMADVTVLTSQQETFSMVTAESLCCGTPVVGFKAGGPETIALENYSRFVEYSDIELLIQGIQYFLSEQLNSQDIVKQASAIYSTDNMLKSYLSIYHELMK